MVKLIFTFTLNVCLVFSGESQKVLTINEPLGKIHSMKSDIDFSFGRILLERGQEDFAVTGFLMYDASIVAGKIQYSTYGSMGILEVNTDTEIDWPFGNDWDSDSANQCELYLSPKIAQKITFYVGLGEAEINLNGIQYNHFSLDCGLGEASINFGEKQNTIKCEKLYIDVGIGSVEVVNLLNSNTTEMNFECGLGELDLDFSGVLSENVTVEASIGLGSIDVLLPRGINVIVDSDKSFLSSLDLKDFKKLDNGEYQSDVYDPEKPTLHFDISIGAGSAEFQWKDK